MKDNISRLVKKLENFVTGDEFELNIKVKNLRNREVIFEHNTNEKFECEGLGNLFIASSVLDKVADKQANFNDDLHINVTNDMPITYVVESKKEKFKLREVISAMLMTNDYNAGMMALDYVGIDEANKFIKNEGLTNTVVGKKSETTIEELSKFVELIYNKKIIIPRLCDYMIKYMELNKDNYTFNRLILERMTTVQLTGHTDNTACGFIVVKHEHIDYMIVVNVKNAKNYPVGRNIISVITREIYETLKYPSEI